ncbi:hypothetical protein MCOR25_006749 [Pyricularia grisea]|uniref:Uncharacterized protein n=1 Tax=Pyricularia grisea TaxID=148305 RepID=A0A6P8ATA0_PYRGI|nr:uncharacterized protein PgNI_10054 [Pyricularia grisea]KAI6360380.1 hypothetical protein MCOR25_006749 [Pyricularia grisea]TLD05359.1 hypothetical protein PgNI_10054 [Pyricularia grisea]
MKLFEFCTILALAISVTAIPVSNGWANAVSATRQCHVAKAGRCQCHRAGNKGSRRLTAREEPLLTDSSDDDSDASSDSEPCTSPTRHSWQFDCPNCGTKKSIDCGDGFCGVKHEAY